MDSITIFEKYFYGDESIPLDELYFYFQMLRQTKDLSDSKHVLDESNSTKFDMVTMALRRVEGNITFNGAVSNGVENRCVDGVIKKKGKSYYIITHVYRLNHNVEALVKEYYVYDTFKKKKDSLYHYAIYDESIEYRKIHGESKEIRIPIEDIDMGEFEQFKNNIIKKYIV